MSGGNWDLLLIENDMVVGNRKELVLGKMWLWVWIWMWDGRGAESCHVVTQSSVCMLPEVKMECWKLEWVNVLELLDGWTYPLSSQTMFWEWAAGTLTDECIENSTHSHEACWHHSYFYLWPMPSYQNQAWNLRTFSLLKILFRDGHCNQYYIRISQR